MFSATHSRTWRKLLSVAVFAIALVAVLTLPESVAAQDTCSSGLAVANPDNHPGLVSDCEALLSARDTLAGTGSLNWSASQRINDWDGITVSGSPRRVTKISLVDAGLTGAIPGEFGSLDQLTWLALVVNEISGPIPGELGNLSRLQYLNLAGNRLSGRIPTELSRLASLTDLNLSMNQLSGRVPPELANLTRVRWLELSRFRLNGAIPRALGDMHRLVGLGLSFNNFSGTIPGELGELSNLGYLHLSYNQLSGGIPAELGNLSDLDSLLLDHNHLSGPVPDDLRNLTNLGTLGLGNNQLNGPFPAALTNLSQLTRLYLDNNRFSGTIPEEVGNLSNLIWLDLSNNRFSGPMPRELGILSDLYWLVLVNNQFSGPIPSELGDLDKMDGFRLAGNSFSPTVCIPETLRDIRSNDYRKTGLQFCDEPILAERPRVSRTAPVDAPAGTPLGNPFIAINRAPGELVYSLAGDDAGYFEIGSATGQLMVAEPLDFEGRSSYAVTVVAPDAATDADARSDQVKATVFPPEEGASLRLHLERVDSGRYYADGDGSWRPMPAEVNLREHTKNGVAAYIYNVSGEEVYLRSATLTITTGRGMADVSDFSNLGTDNSFDWFTEPIRDNLPIRPLPE